jgi:hypothetical protein
MINKLINKQLFEIAERNKLNYSYNSICFKLENGEVFDNDKIGKLIISFITIGTFAIVIEIDGNKKSLGKISDVKTLFLLCILRDKLNDNSFPDALKEMCRSYEKIQETIEEIKNNENSTN